ncbi:hypothetical protein [Sphaerisporangium dianthi]|uniref:Uncharacterized protein n=1 Tax=Sphaerisporangium dianthi TaxID=1436120 RepID=A0ABV9CG23_9ACTN
MNRMVTIAEEHLPMPAHFPDLGDTVEWHAKGETPRVDTWGPDSARVRSTPAGRPLDGLPGAPLPILEEPA